ncbi:HisA/HisF-related TIM barrel protein [Curtobacterium flaccumfaciens]|nr:HisA/HisF-related TIM barrel protein [Curtobacterium flaccumfaciens]
MRCGQDRREQRGHRPPRTRRRDRRPVRRAGRRALARRQAVGPDALGLRGHHPRGRTESDLDAIAWAREAVERGAGSCSSTRSTPTARRTGSTSELVAAVRAVSSVPVIASGGAGRVEHFAPAVDAGADAVLAASVFHRGEMTVGDVKAALRATGHAVR